MLDRIPWATVTDVGAGSLVVIVLLILTGKFVLTVQYDQMVQAKVHWRTACEREQAANRLHARAADAQSVGFDTVVKVMSAVQATQGGGAE
jgi:hypothetical protein